MSRIIEDTCEGKYLKISRLDLFNWAVEISSFLLLLFLIFTRLFEWGAFSTRIDSRWNWSAASGNHLWCCLLRGLLFWNYFWHKLSKLKKIEAFWLSLTSYHRSVLYGSIRNDILSLANAIENLSKIEHHILLGVNSPSLPLTYLDLENFAFAQGNLWRSIVTKQSNAEIAAGYILYNHILGSLKFQPVVQLGREIFGKSDQQWTGENDDDRIRFIDELLILQARKSKL